MPTKRLRLSERGAGAGKGHDPSVAILGVSWCSACVTVKPTAGRPWCSRICTQDPNKCCYKQAGRYNAQAVVYPSFKPMLVIKPKAKRSRRKLKRVVCNTPALKAIHAYQQKQRKVHTNNNDHQWHEMV